MSAKRAYVCIAGHSFRVAASDLTNTNKKRWPKVGYAKCPVCERTKRVRSNGSFKKKYGSEAIDG